MKKIRLLFLTLVALLGGVTSALASKTVYLQPNDWANDNAVISLWVWVNGQEGSWATLSSVEDGIYKAVLDDQITTMHIVRGPVGNNFDNKYNESGDITPENGKLYSVNSGSWDGAAVGSGITVTDYSEPVVVEPAGYTVDFNTEIATSDHAFQVASNWRHIVDTYESSWSYDPQYANYSYSATAGVGGSGALSCSTDQNSNSIYDLLVTPVVKGTVTIAAKATATYNTPQLSFFKITDNGDGTFTRGEQITVDVSAINATDYVTITIPVDEAGERIGIRSSYVWLDNFTASEATIIPESKISFVSATSADGNNGTTGQIKWEQQANGKVLVSYTVVVTNTGDVDLVQGAENYSISIIHRETGNVIATVPVPQDLAKGETSDGFVVSGEAESSVWPYSYTEVHMDLKENLFGSTIQRANSTYTAYEPKLVFRTAGSTSTSSISAAEGWGTITESTTKAFEIANTGTAPLTIKSVTLPEGFTSDNAPAAEFTLAKGETQALNITQEAATQGTFAGNLTIVYLDKNGAEQTYTLAFSATVIGANTWTADFNGSSSSNVTYPAGSIAEGGINKDYQYISSGNYNLWLVGYNNNSYKTENNKFITPKLHANAGDKLAFDVKAGYSSSDDYFVKVYVSADRKSWGDPVETYVYSTVGSSFTTKTVTFDAEGDYYVAFAIYGTGSGIDNLVGLEKVDVAHDLYIKEVSWPDASVKSGSSLSKPSVSVIPLTNEAAENYTVKYVSGETVLAEISSKALTASASSTTSFDASWTPEVEVTTEYPATKVVFEFTDGTKFETETFDLTVTNEAIFHFLSSLPSSKWYEPTDYTTPVNFGKTNAADSKSFYVYNWGSAQLQVKSITVPEGFTVTPAEAFTVAAFNESNLSASAQAVEVTFSATEAGIYSGNLVVTYVNGAGEDATFELAVSGTKLDPTKFYANFGAESNQWPAGSVYQSNVSTTYVGSGDYAITSSSTTNNLFITPKLTAADGDKLMFDAKLYSTSWSEGKVVVYAAATRDELVNFDAENDTRKPIFSVSGKDEKNAMTTDYQTFEVPAVAGDNYYAFEISGRPYVDELYGLKVTEVAHDWTLVSQNIPTEGMQNHISTATVNVANFGIADEAAEDITVTAYVDGEAVATAEGVAIPMSHQLNAAGTQLSISYMVTKVGTFPVYVKVETADGYSVQTEAVDVTFAEEVFVADAIVVGTKTASSTNNAIIDFYNLDGGEKNSDIVYTAEQLNKFGVTAGAKITALTFKGTLISAKTISNSLTAWIGTKTGDITWNSPDKTTMTEVTIFDGTMPFVSGVNDIKIDLSENPITYDGTSDLRIYFEGTKGGWASVSFDYDGDYQNMKWSNNSSMKYNPLLYVTVDASPATLAGAVKTSAGDGIKGANVTLKAENGVQYAATTDANGAYSINVIQAGLDFTATVEAEGFLKNEFAYNLGGESKTLDVTLYKQFGLVGTLPGFDWENDKVMTQSTEDPNIFTYEVNGVEVEAGKYSFKLRADAVWNSYQLPSTGGTYTDDKNGYDVVDGNYQWEFKTAGTYNFKFTFDRTNHTLTFERPFTLAEDATGIAALNWVDVTVEREFKAGWNAVVLPFDLSAAEVAEAFGDDSELVVYDGDEGESDVTVKFKKLDGADKYISAGYPYLLWLEQPVSGLKFTKNITAETSYTDGTTFDFVGVYETTAVKEGDYFVAGGEFLKATKGNTVKPFRAYLKLKEGVAPARSISFLIGDKLVTGIDGLTVESETRNLEGVYNLQGQKVQQFNRKGLYIVNGKKVYVK